MNSPKKPIISEVSIQPSWTALPIPSPSIAPTDNDPNWEDTPTTIIFITNLTANRPTSFTHSWSKPY